MGYGKHEKKADEENPTSEDEDVAERQRLNEAEEMEMKKVAISQPKPTRYTPPIVLGSVEPLLKTSHLKYALLTFNCVLALLALVILIVAVWVRADPEFFRYDKTLQIKDFYTVCYLLIVAGVVLLLVAFLGCFGVFVESQRLLIAYFIIYTIIFILQLTALILVFSAPYSDSMSRVIEKQFHKQVEDREGSQNSALFLDYVQQNLECCGAVSQDEYNPNPIPRSCTNPLNGMVYQKGCSSVMLNYLKAKAGIIGGISVPILLFQLLALIVCYCLIYNIRKESGYEM